MDAFEKKREINRWKVLVASSTSLSMSAAAANASASAHWRAPALPGSWNGITIKEILIRFSPPYFERRDPFHAGR